jgi:putative ABC transport system ATP-binding protein
LKLDDEKIPLAINIQNLRFAYPCQKSSRGDSPRVLDIPNWQVETGQKIFLHGPSGSGKSTLLNLLSGTLSLQVNQQNGGEITVLNHAMHSLSNTRKDQFRAKSLGVVFQQLNLINYLSVLDNICLASVFADKNTEFSSEKAMQVLTNLNLPENILHKKAGDLSVGQQQRVAIARALYHQPTLLIVDEPTSALDAQSTGKFMQLLLENTKQLKATLLFVSHDLQLATDFDECVGLNSINKCASNNQDETR